MDCSGTIYYVLTSSGITDVPRSSNLQYQWVETKGHLYPVTNSQSIGKNKAGQPLMAGASNGRAYKGRKIYGISVFDFKVPDRDSKDFL